ncbi:MAG: 50S ribosome-binding GTPase [Archaeoglobaceae archaeon]|nr:50S ribosome-binding GTPase [Archaeoglobaceae archaeon]MCX8152033.1 50S ribosome-binding GTPase [Archaeoglobaceae archaeon]MDW8013590.1 GTPase [Archaeoglobaceae archaeon]
MDFKRLPTVLTAEELIDKMFKKASKVGGRDLKDRTINKLSTISNTTHDYFQRILKEHPEYEKLPDFYREMVDILVGVARLKKALASLLWADKMIQKVVSKSIAETKRGNDPHKILKSTYGRIASIIDQIDEQLQLLNYAKNRLKEIPSLRDIPTVVVAGYPNVGKSSFVAAVSTAKPEIASYPFTTKEIKVGIARINGKEIQILDTPGLLDRPLSEKSEIELKAILCLQYLADLIVFIIDPTETCGYSLENQLSLLNEVKNMFKKPIIEVYSKSDMHNFQDRLTFSAKTGEGIKEIMDEIAKKIKNKRQQ